MGGPDSEYSVKETAERAGLGESRIGAFGGSFFLPQGLSARLPGTRLLAYGGKDPAAESQVRSSIYARNA